MKAVILARVSTQEQATEGHSIEAQIMLLQEYCSKNNLDVIKEFKIIESSTKGDRKDFKEVLKYISSQKETIALVCHKVDRLQRSFNEYHLLNEPLQQGKLELHFTQNNSVLTKDSNSADKLMWNMQIVMAQNYTDCISDNVKRSYEKLKSEGKILGSAPIGYLNKTLEDGSKTVVFDDDRFLLVKRLFNEYATGDYSLEQLSKLSYSWGLRSKKGYKISKNSIADMLDNPFYMGVISLKSKGIQYAHIYPILVDRQTWDRCQIVRDGKKKNYSNKTKKEFIFSGIIRCAKCNCLYSPEIKVKKLKTTGESKEYIYLRPNNKNKCDCKQFNEVKALEVVKQGLNALRLPKGYEEPVRKALKESLDGKIGFKDYSVDVLRKELKAIDKRLDRILDLLVADSITQDEYNKKKEQFCIEKYNIEQRLNKFGKADKNFEATTLALLDMASKSSSLFDSSDSATKRKIIKLVFSNWKNNNGKLEYTYNSSFKLVANLGNCKEWLPGPGSNQRPND